MTRRLPIDATGACPFLGCGGERCNASTSLSRLDEAFRCFTGGHSACSEYQRRVHPNARKTAREPGSQVASVPAGHLAGAAAAPPGAERRLGTRPRAVVRVTVGAAPPAARRRRLVPTPVPTPVPAPVPTPVPTPAG